MKFTVSTCAAVVVALLCLLAPPQALGEGEPDAAVWPFGVAGGRAGFRGMDLYNLGLLGVKVCDPERDPTPNVASGMRRASSADAGAFADIGPNRLKVQLLFPGGPAETAGLRVGDVIVGAGKTFKEGSLQPVADALVKAETGKGKGVLQLRVERVGEKGTLKIDVAVPQGGKAAAKPHEGEARQAIFAKSCAWLAEQQGSNGGYAETLSGPNGAVVQTSLAGLAWLAHGSDLSQGEYKDNIRGAVDFVTMNLGVGGGATGRGATSDGSDGPSWDQTNWGFAHAAIFLGELQARSPDDGVRETLIHCGGTLADRQEKTGGWAHGPGGANALGYIELNIVSGLAIAGIGLAAQAGYELDPDVLVKAADYLEKSGGGDGGVAYSHKDGQRGQGNIGRTGGAWLGFLTLGQGKTKWAKKMERFVRSHAGDVFGGHASLMQHVLLAGVAAHAHGGEARKAYWETALPELTLARTPDGSFQPRPWHETLSIGSNSDVSFGQVWTTAAWAIVLGCEPSDDRPGLPAWMGLDRD